MLHHNRDDCDSYGKRCVSGIYVGLMNGKAELVEISLKKKRKKKGERERDVFWPFGAEKKRVNSSYFSLRVHFTD